MRFNGCYSFSSVLQLFLFILQIFPRLPFQLRDLYSSFFSKKKTSVFSFIMIQHLFVFLLIHLSVFLSSSFYNLLEFLSRYLTFSAFDFRLVIDTIHSVKWVENQDLALSQKNGFSLFVTRLDFRQVSGLKLFTLKLRPHYGPVQPRIQTWWWATCSSICSFTCTAHSFTCFALLALHCSLCW